MCANQLRKTGKKDRKYRPTIFRAIKKEEKYKQDSTLY